MVSVENIQGAVIALLQGNAPVMALTANDVREDEWQGLDFKYPCVRVAIDMVVPQENGNCRQVKALASFTIQCYDDSSSSRRCAMLSGLIVTAIFGQYISHTLLPGYIQAGLTVGFRSLAIDIRKVLAPYRVEPRVWRSDVICTIQLYETSL